MWVDHSLGPSDTLDCPPHLLDMVIQVMADRASAAQAQAAETKDQETWARLHARLGSGG